jgi:trans-aconitate methyltransferase
MNTITTKWDSKLYNDIEFQVSDAANFNFSNKFDSTFSNASLHWVTNHKDAIKRMYNNLNNNEKIVVEFGEKGNVQTIVSQLRNSLSLKGYVKQSKLVLWYFPSISEYTTVLETSGFKVIMTQHIDRPTELADEKSGIKNWISMFAKPFFQGVTQKHMEEIKNEVQEKVKSKCFINGKWFAYYKRIRVIAIKE